MKKILIAGSSSGIGRAIAEKMLAQGHQVIGLARQHEKFNPRHANYFTYKIDFSEITTLEEKFKKIKKLHPEIDVLIGSVGQGEFVELEQFSVKKMQELVNVNFLSQAILVKAFLPLLKERKAGKIILLGSECALAGEKKATLYCATKFALRGFAQSLRKECAASDVGVSLINPGLVDTAFFSGLSFSPSVGERHSLEAHQIADLVSVIIAEKYNCVYEEINLQPMKAQVEKKKKVAICKRDD